MEPMEKPLTLDEVNNRTKNNNNNMYEQFLIMDEII
jgi:hypothetical protein